MKNHKIAEKQTTTKAREKISTDLEIVAVIGVFGSSISGPHFLNFIILITS
jgi:hypothetical protein